MGRKRKLPETEDLIPPEVRNSANERERDRMRVLSKAFVKLKTTLPWVPPDTKLSKLDTLRLATCYIAHLRQILAEDEGGVDDAASHNSHSGDDGSSPDSHNVNGARFTHPINLTWPFSFAGKPPINGSSSPPMCQQSQHEQITAS